MNPLSQAYYNMKRQWGAEDYNPYAEAVYGRAMATPATPNIGGEAIKSLLGAIMASKLGQAKRGYVDTERKQRIADEKDMLDYRSRLEADAQNRRAQQERGLFGLKSALEYGQSFADPSKFTLSPEVRGNIEGFSRALPEIQAAQEDPAFGTLGIQNIIKGGGVAPYVKPEYKERDVPVGTNTWKKQSSNDGGITWNDITGSTRYQKHDESGQSKADQNSISRYRMKRSDLIRQRASLAMKINPLTGQALTPEEADIALRGIDEEIGMYNQYLSELGDTVAPPLTPVSETPVKKKGTIGKILNAIFGGDEAAPPPVQQGQGKRPPLTDLFTDAPKPAQTFVSEAPREPTELDKLEPRKRELIKSQGWIYTDPEVVSISNRMKELRRPAPKSKEAQIKDAKSRMRYLTSQLMGNTKGNKEYQELKAKVQLLEGRDFNPGIRRPQIK